MCSSAERLKRWRYNGAIITGGAFALSFSREAALLCVVFAELKANPRVPRGRTFLSVSFRKSGTRTWGDKKRLTERSPDRYKTRRRASGLGKPTELQRPRTALFFSEHFEARAVKVRQVFALFLPENFCHLNPSSSALCVGAPIKQFFSRERDYVLRMYIHVRMYSLVHE